MSIWSKVAYGLGGVLILVVLFILLFYAWYVGSFEPFSNSEYLRKSTDSLLKRLYDKQVGGGRLISNVVFGNRDKYVWRPPRVVPVYDKVGAISGYDIFGIVTSWDPEARLLYISSYVRKSLTVKLDPEHDNSIAVIAPMDRQGAIPALNAIQIVDSSTFPGWRELFCVGDTVAVQVRKHQELSKGSIDDPIVPMHVRLEHRLCGT